MQILRLLAIGLAVLGVAPLWRLLIERPTGLAGAVTAAQASDLSAVLWSGLLLCAVPGLLAVIVLERTAVESFLARIAQPLTRPRAIVFAFTLSLLATLLATFIALVILGGVPTLIDSFAQLLHARYIAAGQWSGPVTPHAAFWHVQQTVLTEHGWVSQYPPGHVVLLAAGFKAGAVWLVGPLCWGITVFFTSLALERLPTERMVARVAALFAALSPFSLVLSGAFMSHIPAAACAAAALYFLVRSLEAKPWNGAAAGAALGALFTIRPLTAVALAVVATGISIRRPLALVGGLLGALPFALAVAWYNNHFFGSPVRFGYHAALGPNAGLGFGIDPWGNQYGPLQALAYTSAELSSLSLYLFESPLPLVLLIGVYFATGKRSHNEWLLFGWAVAPLIANLFYWHHGLFMGPRMLADAGFAWAALAVVSVIGLIRDMRADWSIGGRYAPRTFATATAAAAVVFGAIVLLPQRIGSYRVDDGTRALLKAPDLEQPSLVFVHGGWTARLAMNLAAHGMRLDSVEAALRQNPTCVVQLFADSFVSGARSAVQLDVEPRATNLPAVAEISPGNRIRVVASERFDERCARQVQADQGGVLDVTPFVWQGDLPGSEPRGALFVRDMGPDANQKLIAAQPQRRPLMMVPDADSVRLVPYAIAERSIWGTP